MNLKEFWRKVFRREIDIDLSMLSSKEFKIVVSEVRRKYGEDAEINWESKRIHISF